MDADESTGGRPQRYSLEIEQGAPGDIRRAASGGSWGEDEDRSAGTARMAEQRRATGGGGIFPIALCCCCPDQRVIPQGCVTLQGVKHILLIISTGASVFYLVKLIMSMYTLVNSSPQEVINHSSAIVFSVLCVIFLLRKIKGIDQEIDVKMQQVEHARMNHIAEFQDLMNRMDDLLDNVAEQKLVDVEDSFEQNRRDFQHFLNRVKATYGFGVLKSADQQRNLMRELRAFLRHWLKVWEECVPDPRKPRPLCSDPDLDCRTTVETLCDIVLQRLKGRDNKFLTNQTEKDARKVDESRQKFETLTVMGEVALSDGRWARMGKGEAGAHVEGISWWSFGKEECGFQDRTKFSSAAAEGRYPKVLGLLCCRIVLLSRTHVCMFLGIFACLALMYWEWRLKVEAGEGEDEDGDFGQRWLYFLLLSIMASFSLYMAQFESIHAVTHLSCECLSLDSAKVSVMGYFHVMDSYWQRVQRLPPLWQYRTVPRLNLFSEIQGFLDDMTPEVFTQSLQRINIVMEEFEGELPKLEHWINEGRLVASSMQAFKGAVDQLCKKKSLVALLQAMSEQRFNWNKGALPDKDVM